MSEKTFSASFVHQAAENKTIKIFPQGAITRITLDVFPATCIHHTQPDHFQIGGYGPMALIQLNLINNS
jgi:hypothetical protein